MKTPSKTFLTVRILMKNYIFSMNKEEIDEASEEICINLNNALAISMTLFVVFFIILQWWSEIIETSTKNSVVPVATSNVKLFLKTKTISLYIYKDLRLSRGWQPSAQFSVWFFVRSCFSALRPKINISVCIRNATFR